MIDIHNHTIYSDGEHMPEEIIKNALEAGIRTLGISDHHRAFFMGSPHYKSFQEYIKEIDRLKNKYKGRINILSGIELNVNFRDKHDEERVPFEVFSSLDYVLLERIEGMLTHEDKHENAIGFKDIGRIAERIPCRLGLAHTDILTHAKILNKDIDYILNIMKKYNIFWELNVQHQYLYFDELINNRENDEVRMLMNKIHKYRIEVIAGSDTHDIKYDFDINRLKMANEFIEDNILGEIYFVVKNNRGM
ncbi:MAG: PHP domain-containing protein [Clostridiaceae bacterium]